MAKPRPRYVAKKRIMFNDKPLEGQVVILLGECNAQGDTKLKGKPLKKKEKTHYKLRFADKKWTKENNIFNFFEFVREKKDFEKFFGPLESQ